MELHLNCRNLTPAQKFDTKLNNLVIYYVKEIKINENEAINLIKKNQWNQFDILSQAIPIKFPACDSADIRKLVLKFICNRKRYRITNMILKEWNKVGDYLNLKLLQHTTNRDNVVLMKTQINGPVKANRPAVEQLAVYLSWTKKRGWI